MKTKMCVLAFLMAGLGVFLASAGAQDSGSSGILSCSGSCFAGVLGAGGVDVNAVGKSYLLVRGNVSIDPHGVGVCNKTKNGMVICRGIGHVEITGRNIRAFLKGNGTLSAEGEDKVAVGKRGLKVGEGTLNYERRGFARIMGEGNLKVDSSLNSTLLVRGKAKIDTHGIGKCRENKAWGLTLCRGIEDVDISGKNIAVTVKGKGSLSNNGKGMFTMWN